MILDLHSHFVKNRVKFAFSKRQSDIFCRKIEINFYSIYICFYLTHFSTFTYGQLSVFSETFLSQIVTLESL